MRNRRGAAAAVTAAVFVLTLVMGVGTASAKGEHLGSRSTPFQDIASSGPLTHVYLGNELSCQVAHEGDTDLELYPPDTIPGDCGTFLVDQGSDKLFAPDFEGHGSTATGSLGSYTIFSNVSQTGVTGSGTSSDPYKVTTVANAGSSFQLTDVDTYVVGQESYTTSVTVKNTASSSKDAILYRAGDCFLGGSDFGTGRVTGSSIACVQTETGRIEEWVPITSGSSYEELFYDDLWAYIGSHQAFANQCRCDEEIDNSAGLSWTFSLNAGESKTFSHITTFSPTGEEALSTSKTADSSTVDPGGQDGYTIDISNPNTQDVEVTSITDTLPDGFSYVVGSTTGVTTDDPTISGQTLTWSGSFTDPAGGDISLHFDVTAATTPGAYDNEAGGEASGGFTVVPTGPTAQVTVTGPATGADLSIKKSDSPDPVFVGNKLTYTLKVSNAGPETAVDVTTDDVLPSGLTFVSASDGCTFTEGDVTCSLGDLESGASTSVTIVVTADSAGVVSNTASVSSDTDDPVTHNNADTAKTTVNEKPSGGVQTGVAPTSKRSPVLPIALGSGLLLLAGGAYLVRRRAKA
jgi:uncharacterized repeat protein (TIGR01451 family)